MTLIRVLPLVGAGLLLASRHADAQTWTELALDKETRVLDVRPSQSGSSKAADSIWVLVAEKRGPALHVFGSDPEKPSFAKIWSAAAEDVCWGRIVADIDGDARPEVVTWSKGDETRMLLLRGSGSAERDVVRLEPVKPAAAGAPETGVVPTACVTSGGKDAPRIAVLWTSGPEQGIRDSALELYDGAGSRIGRMTLGRDRRLRLGGLVSVGDVDGDGAIDLAVRRAGVHEEEAASVCLLSGKDMHAIWETASKRGGDVAKNFGGLLVSGADVDRDGILDLAVYADAYGANVIVLSGRDGALLSTIINPTEDETQFGAALQLLPAARPTDPVLLFIGHPDLNVDGSMDAGGIHVVDARKGEILGRIQTAVNHSGAELGEFVGVVRDPKDESKVRLVMASIWRCYAHDALPVPGPLPPK